MISIAWVSYENREDMSTLWQLGMSAKTLLGWKGGGGGGGIFASILEKMLKMTFVLKNLLTVSLFWKAISRSILIIHLIQIIFCTIAFLSVYWYFLIMIHSIFAKKYLFFNSKVNRSNDLIQYYSYSMFLQAKLRKKLLCVNALVIFITVYILPLKYCPDSKFTRCLLCHFLLV